MWQTNKLRAHHPTHQFIGAVSITKLDDSVDCRITEMNLDVAGGTEGDIDVTVRISSSPDGLSPGDPEYTPHIYYIIIMLYAQSKLFFLFYLLSQFPPPAFI